MNFTKLFATQAILDKRIVNQKELHGVDLLDQKTVALLAELGELLNEWRGFKFWSEDREARTVLGLACEPCFGKGYINHEDVSHGSDPFDCNECNGKGIEKIINPLLEEYVDCLHLILSVGIELKKENTEIKAPKYLYSKEESVTHSFMTVFELVSDLDMHVDRYSLLFTRFIELGEMLDFTTDQIEQAYYSKNEINHERQESGY